MKIINLFRVAKLQNFGQNCTKFSLNKKLIRSSWRLCSLSWKTLVSIWKAFTWLQEYQVWSDLFWKASKLMRNLYISHSYSAVMSEYASWSSSGHCAPWEAQRWEIAWSPDNSSLFLGNVLWGGTAARKLVENKSSENDLNEALPCSRTLPSWPTSSLICGATRDLGLAAPDALPQTAFSISKSSFLKPGIS